ncbi:MAG: cysteine desulfurase [Myxococcota bacterium]|nr:cysteine desulfurase [Myxococcota bacterium]
MSTALHSTAFDVERVRRDFPCLQQQVHGKPLIYLDNAATTQVPRSVISTLSSFHIHDRANIHRGVHLLSQRSTAAYDAVRGVVREFINAPEEREIVFVRGTTEALNLLANTLGTSRLEAGDEVLITGMEHHSNIVPWQLVCAARGAHLKVIPITDEGELDMAAFEALLSDRTKILSMVHVSNALGTINPVKEMIRAAREKGAVTILDGAQAIAHMPVDVVDLGCDFYAFSGHKLFGPTGVGVLWGRAEILNALPPWQGGGDMIRSVTFEETTYADIPARFEAGTPNIAGVIGLGAAIEYLQSVGLDAVSAYEAELLEYGTKALQGVAGLRLVGTAREKASVLSFVLDGVHPHDIGTILDMEGVAIRTGHHCAQPVMDRLGVPATARASLSFYNTHADIDALVTALGVVKEMMGR